eukprot:scaffold20725_cov111-Isochrysis_galbana.AAC.18
MSRRLLATFAECCGTVTPPPAPDVPERDCTQHDASRDGAEHIEIAQHDVVLAPPAKEEEGPVFPAGFQRHHRVTHARRRGRASHVRPRPRPCVGVENRDVVAEVKPVPVGSVVPTSVDEHARAVKADSGVPGAGCGGLACGGRMRPLHRRQLENVGLGKGALGVVAAKHEHAAAGEPGGGVVGAAGGRAAAADGPTPGPVRRREELVQLGLDEAAGPWAAERRRGGGHG